MKADLIHALDCTPDHPLGGKAQALARLSQADFRVPSWFAVTDGTVDSTELSSLLDEKLYAVRSSAVNEDGSEHSFAGQYESYLNISPENVIERIEDVRRSTNSDHLDSYSSNRKIEGDTEIGVIVQEMVDAQTAGVAFGANPITGERQITLISATPGLGEALVSGETDGDTWEVDSQNHIRSRTLVDDNKPCLSDQQIAAVTKLCQKCNEHFGRPQDIEWAFDKEGVLWLLQSRAITTLTTLPDPADELTVWDNSNIAESYGGVTSTLTFSFAARIYEHVYREFCKLLSVPAWKIQKHDEVFPKMLGHIDGRVYYNLTSWYRVLALLPGFQLNRSFMEQMMGVKVPMPEEIVETITAETRTSKWRDTLALLMTSFGLIRSHWQLPAQIKRFEQRLNDALELSSPLSQMRAEELVSHYKNLEKQLLHRWDAPLVNDFFAMIFYGILSKLCGKWLNDENGTLQNELLIDSGDIISARPPRLIKEMAEVVRPDQDLAKLLADPAVPNRTKITAIRNLPALDSLFQDYLTEFGDRCLEELKLESPTLVDDPSPLIQAIGSFAQRDLAPEEKPTTPEIKIGSPLKRGIFSWVLRKTRNRVRDRENLRFERTRLFGRVRKIMKELGSRLTADGQLAKPEDVFLLKLEEVLGAYDHTNPSTKMLETVQMRRSEQQQQFEAPDPPDRFTTRGALHRHSDFAPDTQSETSPTDTSKGIQGIGACAGIVRGPVRIVTHPREAQMQPGEILVATQTDPGWVVLFPASSGLLVERGSLLSHSAIVARELKLPCIVSLSGITKNLKTGDIVEMNGKTGTVTLIDHEN